MPDQPRSAAQVGEQKGRLAPRGASVRHGGGRTLRRESQLFGNCSKFRRPLVVVFRIAGTLGISSVRIFGDGQARECHNGIRLGSPRPQDRLSSDMVFSEATHRQRRSHGLRRFRCLWRPGRLRKPDGFRIEFSNDRRCGLRVADAARPCGSASRPLYAVPKSHHGGACRGAVREAAEVGDINEGEKVIV